MSNNHKKRKKKKANPQLQDVIINTIMENKQISIVAAVVAIIVVIIIIATHSPNKPGAKEIIDLNISGNTAPVTADAVIIQNSEATSLDYSTNDSGNNPDYYTNSSDYATGQDNNMTNNTSSVVVNGQEVSITTEDGETAIIVDTPADNTSTGNTTTDNSTMGNTSDTDSFTFELPFVPADELN